MELRYAGDSDLKVYLHFQKLYIMANVEGQGKAMTMNLELNHEQA